MTGKPSGVIEKRARRRAERKERAERCERLRLDIGILRRAIEQSSDAREQARLSVKLRNLRQRLRYINREETAE
jgi:hypothetical protein